MFAYVLSLPHHLDCSGGKYTYMFIYPHTSISSKEGSE